MDKCSYFILNKALFGSSPSQETVSYLEQIGVKYFIDLTHTTERNLDVYTTKYTKISYPIVDRKYPSDNTSFAIFILKVYKILKKLQPNEKIYIHCKGGHGRSGLVVACLLCIYLKISPHQSLILTSQCHQKRQVMRDKWRIIGSPQTIGQKEFVVDFFKPMYFTSVSSNFLSNTSIYPIVIPNFGTFQCVESAYQAYKNPGNSQYVFQQTLTKDAKTSKKLGKEVDLRPDWDNVRIKIMHMVLKFKFDQHPELKHKLIQSCMGPIIRISKRKTFWTNSEFNISGKLLQKLRNDYLILM